MNEFVGDYPLFRAYGKPPYEIVVVHGGPGAPGEMAPVAKKLSEISGTLEPLQRQSSIEGQISELQKVLHENCTSPVILIGWSWGAMLSFMFTARHPKSIKKLILISSGPFESTYAEGIMATRLARLSADTKQEIENLDKRLDDPNIVEKQHDLKKFAEITFKTDSYCSTGDESHPLEYQYELHKKVWEEAQELRSNGQLLACASHISCPVVAIHGDYDPHPFQGIKNPLSHALKNFRLVLLENCGHYPWYEKEAKEKFYEILREEITFIE